MGIELEYKLAAPSPAALDALWADPAVEAARLEEVRRIEMATVYYDTADRRLGALLAADAGPKLRYACRRARELAAEGQKVIIWSQFVKSVRLLTERLQDLGADCIDGSVPTGDEDEEDTDGDGDGGERLLHAVSSASCFAALMVSVKVYSAPFSPALVSTGSSSAQYHSSTKYCDEPPMMVRS